MEKQLNLKERIKAIIERARLNGSHSSVILDEIEKVLDSPDPEIERLRVYEKWVNENIEATEYTGFLSGPGITRDYEMWEFLTKQKKG